MAIKGGGVSFALSAGSAISESFILGAQVWDVIAASPTVELSSGTTTASGSAANSSAGLVGFGALLNWYFPSDVYIALTPSLTRLTASNGSTSGNSDWGFGLRAALGKEWWVSDHWSLGASAGIAYSSNKDSGDAGAPTWSTFAFNVGLSSTFN
jgi:hypothetical protein